MFINKILYTTLLLLVTVQAKETDYGSSKYEYMEVFNNIPRMFEYFLYRIAEKPEMLEKDDITVFIKSANVIHHDYGKDKRNVYFETEQVTDNYITEVKSETDSQDEPNCNISQSKRESEINAGNELDQFSDKEIQIKKVVQGKRDTDTKLNNVIKYCYNNGVVSNCSTGFKSAVTNTKKNTVNRGIIVNTNTETPGNQYNYSHKSTSDSEKPYPNNSVHNLNNLFKKIDTKKRDTKYLAHKSSKIYRRQSPIADVEVSHLSPEEIEDAALLMEQILEDYNNKQSKEVE